MSLQNYCSQIYRYLPLCDYIWDGSYNPYKNWHAHHSNRYAHARKCRASNQGPGHGRELRESTAVCIVSYQCRMPNSYNKWVKPRMFQPGDLVLRKVFENTANPTTGKFQPNWEGPYLVTRADESGSYALDKLDGTPVPRMWNVIHLKRYYQ